MIASDEAEQMAERVRELTGLDWHIYERGVVERLERGTYIDDEAPYRVESDGDGVALWMVIGYHGGMREVRYHEKMADGPRIRLIYEGGSVQEAVERATDALGFAPGDDERLILDDGGESDDG